MVSEGRNGKGIRQQIRIGRRLSNAEKLRTEYFKNLIKDKTRTKRWRKVLLCLSCVVVFWTVYALILPAITLESKKCNIEEHTHSAECYSESQELICGKEEHVHTAECTSINNDLSDSGEEAGTVPDASGNDANGNEEGKNTPEESVIPEESVVPAEPEPSSGREQQKHLVRQGSMC